MGGTVFSGTNVLSGKVVVGKVAGADTRFSGFQLLLVLALLSVTSTQLSLLLCKSVWRQEDPLLYQDHPARAMGSLYHHAWALNRLCLLPLGGPGDHPTTPTCTS